MHAPLALLSLSLGCAPKVSPERRVVSFDEPAAAGDPAASDPAANDPAANDPAAELPPPWRGHRQAAGPGPLRRPQERWRVRLGGPITSPPAVHDGALWVVSAGQVARVEADGTVTFRSELDAVGSVAATSEGVVVGARDGALLALSPLNGRPSLAWPGTGRPRGGAVPAGSQLAWITSEGSVRFTGGAVHSVALSAAGGPSSDGEHACFQSLDGELWLVGPDGPAWKARSPGPGIGEPVVTDSSVIAAWDSLQGDPGGVQSVDLRTGQLRWRSPTSSAPVGGLALGDELLVPVAEGLLLALEPASGALIWEAVLGGHEPTTAPLIAGKSAWVGDAGGSLFRIDLDDGGTAWSLPLGASITGDPVIFGDLLVVGLANGDLVALGAGI